MDHASYIKAMMANFLVISVATFTNIEMVLKILLLLVSIFFTLFKIWSEFKKQQKDE